MGTLRDLCQAHVASLQAFVNKFAEHVAHPEDWFSLVGNWTNALRSSVDDSNFDLLESLASHERRRALSEFLIEIGRYQSSKEAFLHADVLIDGEIASKSELLMNALERRGLGAFTLEQLTAIIEDGGSST